PDLGDLLGGGGVPADHLGGVARDELDAEEHDEGDPEQQDREREQALPDELLHVRGPFLTVPPANSWFANSWCECVKVTTISQGVATRRCGVRRSGGPRRGGRWSR